MNKKVFAITFILRVLGLLAAFSLNVYLARSLDKDVLGSYFFFTQLLIVVSVFSRYGADVGFVKYGRYIGKSNFFTLIYRLTIRLSLPITFVMILASFCFDYFGAKDLSFLSKFISLTLVPLTIINLISEYLKGNEKQISATIFQSLAIPTGIFILYFSGISVFSAYQITLIIVVSAALLFIFLFLKDNDPFPEATFLNDSRTFLGIGLLNVILLSMDTVMLGSLGSSEEVANYGISNRLVAVSSIILVVVNGIIGPKLSLLWIEGKILDIRRVFYYSTSVMFLMSLSIMLFFLFFGKAILETFYGVHYIQSYDVLVILAFAQFIVLGTGPAAYLLMMTNGKRVHRKSLYFAVVLNFILNVSLIPQFGAIGAALATAISLALKNIYSFIFIFSSNSPLNSKGR
jgi:O-antigen/teichoic acid export membrane protein